MGIYQKFQQFEFLSINNFYLKPVCTLYAIEKQQRISNYVFMT